MNQKAYGGIYRPRSRDPRLHVDGETVLPAIAGATEPAHTVVARDPLDPQFRDYRLIWRCCTPAISLPTRPRQYSTIARHHHDTILGMPAAYGYNTGELAGFLSYGYGYGLIQTR